VFILFLDIIYTILAKSHQSILARFLNNRIRHRDFMQEKGPVPAADRQAFRNSDVPQSFISRRRDLNPGFIVMR